VLFPDDASAFLGHTPQLLQCAALHLLLVFLMAMLLCSSALSSHNQSTILEASCFSVINFDNYSNHASRPESIYNYFFNTICMLNVTWKNILLLS
jgi:hypothetical protein